MSSHIKNILLRCILNSCAKISVEAELVLDDGSKGIASVPVAIKAGRREKSRSRLPTQGWLDFADDVKGITELLKTLALEDQDQFDDYLNNQAFREIGADISLALSLAFARANAASQNISFVQYLAALGNFQPRMPHPLINIFSGGIHGHPDIVPFQQIMIAPHYDTVYEDIDVGLHIYQEIECKMLAGSLLTGYSSSSGMLVTTCDYKDLLEEVAIQIARLNASEHVSLGVDVAAEHLRCSDGHYQFAGRSIDGEELMGLYSQLTKEFNVNYIEDPFDASDTELWQKLGTTLDKEVLIVGDDLFATNSKYIVKGMANGILLKMNQAGTLKMTVEAALKAREYGMSLCLSHRSCETEDTTMCDLAVAIGADLIKIGGPRRGDRVMKYNQLLRLVENI
jgi:enolase